jgi:hypothetical protein
VETVKWSELLPQEYEEAVQQVKLNVQDAGVHSVCDELIRCHNQLREMTIGAIEAYTSANYTMELNIELIETLRWIELNSTDSEAVELATSVLDKVRAGGDSSTPQ